MDINNNGSNENFNVPKKSGMLGVKILWDYAVKIGVLLFPFSTTLVDPVSA